MMTDPIADMLTRIRNAVRVERPHVEMPLSKVKRGLAEVLKREGYIWDWEEVAGRAGQPSPRALEVRSQRRAGDPADSPRQQAGPARLQRRLRPETDPRRFGDLDPQHQPRRDQRSRGPAAETRRRGALRSVVRRVCRSVVRCNHVSDRKKTSAGAGRRQGADRRPHDHRRGPQGQARMGASAGGVARLRRTDEDHLGQPARRPTLQPRPARADPRWWSTWSRA